MSAEYRVEDGLVLPTAEAVLPASALLVRPLALPTVSLRDARAAVLLQLDRLSPVPKDEVLFDLVLIGPVADKTLFAVGLTRREDVARACSAPVKPARYATAQATVDGREISFKFDDPSARDRRRAEWLSVAPHATALSLALLAFTSAVVFRLDREVQAATQRVGALRSEAEVVQRAAADRQVAVGTWKSAAEADLARDLICALDRLSEASPDQLRIVAVETRQGKAALTLAGLPQAAAQSLAGQRGVTVTGEGAGPGSRHVVQVDQGACA